MHELAAMAARATRSASGSSDDASRCLLLALSHDELGVIVDGLADPLQPVVAVALSSTCLGLRTPLQAALEAAAAERAALQSRMEGDFATAHEAYKQQAAAYAKQMEEQLEAEKEKRVAHLQQQAMRRIANAGIASGFSAWQEQWAEAARKKRMVLAAGARLARPALAAALAGWVADWRAAELALHAEAVRASLLEKDGEQMAVQVS